MAKIDEFKILSDYREVEKGIDELAISIQNTGLLQPIIVRPLEEGGYEILAGRRRFKAMSDYLHWESLKKNEHYIVKEGISALLVQFQENFSREDFSPVEVARIVKDIHEQKVFEHGPSVKGKTGGWGLKDTGRLMGRDSGFISRMISIVENEEEVKDCKTVNQALETINKKKSQALKSKVSKAKYDHKEATVSDDLEYLLKNVENIDAETYLSKLQDESVDIIHTDPPYAIDYDEIVETTDYESYEDDPEEIKALLVRLMPEYYRVLAPNAYCIIWAATQHFAFIQNAMKEVGFSVSSTGIYWVKLNTSGNTMNPKRTPGSVVENAVFGWKGDPELGKPGSTNAFPVPIVRTNRIHVAQKPDQLISEVLSVFARKGDTVLDTFAGSFSTLRACYELGMNHLGCELSQGNIIEAVNYTREWGKR